MQFGWSAASGGLVGAFSLRAQSTRCFRCVWLVGWLVGCCSGLVGWVGVPGVDPACPSVAVSRTFYQPQVPHVSNPLTHIHTHTHTQHPPPYLKGGFSWIAFSLLFFQPRIPAHRAGSALLAATQMPALHNYCATHHGAALGRCMAWGAFKVSLLALLPHFGVYCLEGRARRLFLQAAARQLQASPDLD